FVATDQPNRAKKVLEQVDLFATSEVPDEDASGIFLVEGNPAGGFVAPDANLALVTDQELFGVQRLKLPQRKFNEGVPVATVLDLKPGDYVVHITFGIGIYRGLVKRQQDGVDKEFLFIEYKAPDKLFLPADQLDRIQKYLAPGDAAPKVNRLSGMDWRRTVGKAREDAREMARELIKLYAKRRAAIRPSYKEDSPEQAEMEHTFPWVETHSQLAAIQDVKEDMEVAYPMDRLVCGDVGFGKTEVAIRAAFKAVDNGRQVAVLCPTTILSEQHARNFRERLEPFGVKVELINRFRHAADRRAVEAGLKDGSVQVVVGTHALLNNSLQFADLGLLVVDEEQKFGVKHKETLKQLRVNVDVLSMSATPIPRTLSMALMHIRPMSLINDPPPGRLPIRSYVRPFSSEVVREALLRELARGGQVYYVSNRVEGIYHVAERVRELVPTARVAVGHGQMTESELEPVMVGFVRGDIDILISTTIVENGLDISNANTIIIENADKFGLSQLYQLRGRVGRSDRQAYAYMLYTADRSLTENAMARLEALQEFAHLGSGYSLAFRDLQIRGAGDILGGKQSGQMQAVGFELYTQLIDSEVKFLKSVADGEEVPELDDPLVGLEPLPTIDLPIHVLIPSDYIEEEAQRLYYYQRMMGCRTEESLEQIQTEIQDRYGRLPSSVRNGLSIMRLRLIAQKFGVEKVNGHQGRILVAWRNPDAVPPRLLPMIQRTALKAYRAGDDFIFPFEGDALVAAREVLHTIERAMLEMDEHRAALITGAER
ncbi:MAG: transcription-repair coupling factor, partial [Fimbriimonadaceae bacterium]|nr:transcription-repair coupling factor [Fimbriimonadaceae bacterium]